MKKIISIPIIAICILFSCHKSLRNYYNYEALQTIENAAQKHKSHFEFVWQTRDGLKMYSQCWKPKKKARAVICLVHGLGEHSGRYTHLAKFLTDSGFALAAFDLRGHGRSQGTRGHFASYDLVMEDITLFIKEVKKHFHTKPLFLYGQSTGGNFVINYALRFEPDIAGIILTSPLLRPAFKTPFWKIALGKTMYYMWPTLSLSNGVDLNALSRDTSVASQRKNDTLTHDRVTPRFLAVLSAGEWALANTERLDLPLLLIHGDADRITSFEASETFAKKTGSMCTFKICHGYYHTLHEELDRDTIFAAMTGWMNRKIHRNY